MDDLSGYVLSIITILLGMSTGGLIGAVIDYCYRHSYQKVSFIWSGVLFGAGLGALIGGAPITALLGLGLGGISLVDNIKKTDQKEPKKVSI